jgi:hypothetical protein
MYVRSKQAGRGYSNNKDPNGRQKRDGIYILGRGAITTTMRGIK